MNDDIGERLSTLLGQTPANTNLRNTPNRYLDNASKFAGAPPNEWDAWGGVDPELPNLVYIDKSDPDWPKTMAHEGTHSKQILAGKKQALPELSDDFVDNISQLLEADPEFLRQFLGHRSDKRKYKDINNLDELTSRPEIIARLQAMEAMGPKGQMLEKSKFGKEIFPSEVLIDNYLSATIPEGYIRNNQSNTFRKTPNQTTANPNKGVLEMLKGLFSK
jgi:hypothetical protein